MSATGNLPHHQDEPAAGIHSDTADSDLRMVDSCLHLLNISHEAIVCVDEHWRIAVFNQGAEKLFGYRREDALGMPFFKLVCRRFRIRERRRLSTLVRIARDNRIGFRTDRIICRRRNGERFPTDISLSQALPADRRFYTLVVHDTTERVRQAERLVHAAGHDRLTDLPNRTLLDERLRAGIARADRFGRKLGIVYLDLDRFKPVNDRFGHEAGDCLLQAVADRLRESMRRSDTLSRVGGDEFIICLEQIKSVEDALAATRKIHSTLSAPFLILGQEIEVSASIGIAVYPDHSDDGETLLRLADQAMYRSKAEGLGPVLCQPSQR